MSAGTADLEFTTWRSIFANYNFRGAEIEIYLTGKQRGIIAEAEFVPDPSDWDSGSARFVVIPSPVKMAGKIGPDRCWRLSSSVYPRPFFDRDGAVAFSRSGIGWAKIFAEKK